MIKIAYIKTDWKTGDIISSVRMNKIEDGIEKSLEATQMDYIFNSGSLGDVMYFLNRLQAEMIRCKIMKEPPTEIKEE